MDRGLGKGQDRNKNEVYIKHRDLDVYKMGRHVTLGLARRFRNQDGGPGIGQG